tara:strand:- start:21082 stop:22488 length:1407 start_codon:yes stop_codon:yes gene_type:complete
MSQITICSLCGHENSAEVNFCSKCRARLNRNQLEEATNEKLSWYAKLADYNFSVVRTRSSSFVILAFLALIFLWQCTPVSEIFEETLVPTTSMELVPDDNTSWGAFGKNASGSSYTQDNGTKFAGNISWLYRTTEPLTTVPVISNGHAFLASGDNRLIKLDTKSGDVLWSITLTGPPDSSPALTADSVYIGLKDHRIISIDRSTGDINWEYTTDNPVFSSPTIKDGKLYIGSADNNLYALDAHTGKVIWKYATDSQIYTGIASNDEIVATISSDKHLHVVSAMDGQLRLKYRTAFSRGSTLIDDFIIYVSDENGGIRAIDWREKHYPFEYTIRNIKLQLFIWGIGAFPEQKGLIWSFRQKRDRFTGSMAIDDNNVYGSTSSGKLIALNKHTGQISWTFEPKIPISSSPSIAGNKILVGDTSGYLHLIDSMSGNLVRSFLVNEGVTSTPILVEKTLFVTSNKGTLYAIR